LENKNAEEYWTNHVLIALLLTSMTLLDAESN